MLTRLISSITVIGVLFWLLPLGAWIKPSQENKACNGQRAFHMCTQMMKTNEAATSKIKFGQSHSDNASQPSKITVFSNATNAPSPKSSVSGTIHLWLFNTLKISFRQKSIRFDLETSLEPQIYVRSIDHPPKI
jgi:hypothetical protein